MDNDDFTFWNNVKLRTKEFGWTITTLSFMSGVSENAIRSAMSRNQCPLLITAYKIANALECSVEFLITGEETAIINHQLPEDLQKVINKYANKN